MLGTYTNTFNTITHVINLLLKKQEENYSKHPLKVFHCLCQVTDQVIDILQPNTTKERQRCNRLTLLISPEKCCVL